MRQAILVLVAVLGAFAGLSMRPTSAAPPNNPCNPVNLHPNGLNNGQVGAAYSDLLWMTPGNPLLPLVVTATGLPPGLSFTPGPNSNQVTLSGTPTTAGTYTFTITIGGTWVYGTFCSVGATFTVVIAP